MRIAMLATGSCIHSIRWANALADHGMQIHLFSLHPFSRQLSGQVVQHRLRFGPPHGYFFNVSEFKRQLKSLSPDLLHTHYASGYGTLGRLSGFHPQILSVWGSDVYDFPNVGRWHRALIVRNLKNADLVCSTSCAMERQVRQLCSDLGSIPVTPFGVDTGLFCPSDEEKRRDVVTIGTVKKLLPKYGIDTLIRGFDICRRKLIQDGRGAQYDVRLKIVGDGPQQAALEKLIESLGIGPVTTIQKAVPHTAVPRELRELDIYVAASRLDSESFGVAVIEASACGLPVVVTDVGGLPEVVERDVTGLIVPKDEPEKLAEALLRLVRNPELRQRLGHAGRRRVISMYGWHNCVRQMMDLYTRLRQRDRLAA